MGKRRSRRTQRPWMQNTTNTPSNAYGTLSDDNYDLDDMMDASVIVPKRRTMAAMGPDNPVIELLENDKLSTICAPMVRFSKLPFRDVVRRHGSDIVYTPMIMADSFVATSLSREVEFSTHIGDRPLVVQFASYDSVEFANAAEFVAPYCDVVELNCGCPQTWAWREGLGARLIHRPELLQDMIKQTWQRVGGGARVTPGSTERIRYLKRTDVDAMMAGERGDRLDDELGGSVSVPVAVKMRVCGLDSDGIRKTVDLCKQIEAAGASFITVHGRTVKGQNDPANMDIVRLVKENVNIPVVANGDINSLAEADTLRHQIGVNGTMSARALLCNPAMWSGYDLTPFECLQDFVNASMDRGLHAWTFRTLIGMMLSNQLPRSMHTEYNRLNSTGAVLEWLRENCGIA